jgi:hypothetical protein
MNRQEMVVKHKETTMTARSNVSCTVALAAVMLLAGGTARAAEPVKPGSPSAAAEPPGQPEARGPLAG